ncbi:MAG TPA: hypothetical protein VGY91_13675 [Chthoniobacterales bacterium]|jgi:hypothetical protein|nr:hypothetical protein [Chthoniobacterales bacterium]
MKLTFLLAATLNLNCGYLPVPGIAQALEAVPAQPAEGNVNAWNLGLIPTHRPEFTPAENRSRVGELRADIGNRFGLLQVLGRYVPKAGAEPIEERAFLLRGKAGDSGNLMGFLCNAGPKLDQEAVIWKGEDQDGMLFALKDGPVLAWRLATRKALGFPTKSYRPISHPPGKGQGRSVRSVGGPWNLDHTVLFQPAVQTVPCLTIKLVASARLSDAFQT